MEGTICGIYKITSPTGRIYIGQSEKIEKRWEIYKRMNSSTKVQVKLWRSFQKHGVGNHVFEIIEECLLEDLNCRERYYQDFYNVITIGLNCRLTDCGEVRGMMSENTKRLLSKVRLEKGVAKEGNNGNAKKVINYNTEEILDCGKILSRFLNIEYSTLMCMLNGYRFNTTSWCFLSDYEDKSYLENLKPKNIDSGKEVICTVTLKIWRNITSCANENGIDPYLLRGYLNPNNNRKNPTFFMYLKDY